MRIIVHRSAESCTTTEYLVAPSTASCIAYIRSIWATHPSGLSTLSSSRYSRHASILVRSSLPEKVAERHHSSPQARYRSTHAAFASPSDMHSHRATLDPPRWHLLLQDIKQTSDIPLPPKPSTANPIHSIAQPPSRRCQPNPYSSDDVVFDPVRERITKLLPSYGSSRVIPRRARCASDFIISDGGRSGAVLRLFGELSTQQQPNVARIVIRRDLGC
ncbi:hypothetical protein DE146DRAFT_664514 [Phaeosphaeria sp. MPI-PUGE-AT-0046c]|nr:hypothetical protein DE146DRAFT_664514 [Phaeosphaeria sp. MPI-PUGE-AT-0046c]